LTSAPRPVAYPLEFLFYGAFAERPDTVSGG